MQLRVSFFLSGIPVLENQEQGGVFGCTFSEGSPAPDVDIFRKVKSLMVVFVMTSSLIRLFCSCWMLKLQTSLVMLGAMDVWMDMALTVLALDFGGLIDSFVVNSTGRLLHDVGAWMAFHFSGLVDYFGV